MVANKGSSSPSVLAWAALSRIYALVARCVEKDLTAKRLTLPKFEVIAQLGMIQKGCSQEALCERLLVTKGNVSGLISRMVKEGLVLREESPSDRRCNCIRLTARGKKIFQEVAPEHKACLDHLFSKLGPKEQVQLKNSLLKLLRCAKEKAGYGA